MSNYITNFYQQFSGSLNNSYCQTTFIYGSGSKNLSLGIPMEEIGNGSTDHGGSIKKVLPTTCLIYKMRGHKPIQYNQYDKVYDEGTYDDEFIEDISCGESASAFLTSKGRVFTSANSANHDASNKPSFIFSSYSDPKKNTNEGMVVELNLSKIEMEERQLLIDEGLPESVFGVKQVCVLSNQLCIVTRCGFVWMLSATQTNGWFLLKFYKREKKNELARIKYVTSGLSHLIALSEDGEIFSIGVYDNYGACGCGSNLNPTPNQVNYPTVPLEKGDSILDVYAGYYRTLLVSKLGKLYVCGWGVYHQQGVGHTENINNFILHERMAKTGEKIIKVALGALHTICLCKSGRCYAWGFNSYGQCGDVTDNHSSPILIKNVKKIKDIFCGWHFSILQTVDGEFYGAGANSSGELSSISTTDGSNVSSFKLMQLPKVSVDNSQLVWRIYTCSFSSNIFYMGRLPLSKRNQWMFHNMKNLVREESRLTDIVIHM